MSYSPITGQLASTTPGSSGSSVIGDDNSYIHFTPGTATVKGALSAIDTALGTLGGGGGATIALDNLGSTAINTNLIFGASVVGSLKTKDAVNNVTLVPTGGDLFDGNLPGANSIGAAKGYLFVYELAATTWWVMNL